MACRSSSPAEMVAIMAFMALMLCTSVRAGCDYSLTCSNVKLSGVYLEATCTAENGTSVSTKLNLDEGLSNTDGQLTCPGADFAATCPTYELSGTTLLGWCENVSGVIVESTVDLDDCISNDNGLLEFCNSSSSGKASFASE